MAPFNTRIVRRSNALQDWAYGRELRYSEVMGSGRGPLGAVAAAGMVTGGLVAFLGAMALPPTRALLDRVLPAPGIGPVRGGRGRRAGSGRSSTRRPRAAAATGPRSPGQGDPGYAATAVMLGRERAGPRAATPTGCRTRAGSLTPATAMGTVLVERLRAAGHTYEVTPA